MEYNELITINEVLTIINVMRKSGWFDIRTLDELEQRLK